MTTIKKKTTTRKNTKKEQEPTPWHKIMWVRALGFITVLGAILTVLDTSTSLFDKFYKPTPKEIVVDGSPIVAHYSKKSSTSIKERVPYTFRIQTYRVDYIETDSIKMLDIKIENKRVVNMDSITTRSVQFYPGSGSGSSIEGETAWHEIEDIFNIYLTLYPSIAEAKLGKKYEIGYARFSIPYYVGSVRKIKEQEIPIELHVVE